MGYNVFYHRGKERAVSKRIPPLWWGWRVLDYLLTPFMWVFNKFRWERPQETHPWHIYRKRDVWSLGVLNLSKAVVHIPESKEQLHSRWSPWFHIPILGTGWERYIVLRPDCSGNWHIGWITPGNSPEINRLRLKNGEKVKVLISGGDVIFFGVTPSGDKVHLTKLDEGYLGDKKNAQVRQF